MYESAGYITDRRGMYPDYLLHPILVLGAYHRRSIYHSRRIVFEMPLVKMEEGLSMKFICIRAPKCLRGILRRFAGKNNG
ncbi:MULTISPECIES: hypothetical protein [unclassified Clostridium]|uniref:hypothetical protein n=1 Tax=unclassified Clostridium TaxID=2614128 RepID=UPI0011061048|nr:MULTISPECIES: hypothetical protein [unclassified Clostridium]